jgi:hypothetical protein
VQTRIPTGAKVLLCTTTNKAIDSLAEKIHACGHEDILAFGNAARLGATSQQLTLTNRVAAHDSVRNVEKLERVFKKAQKLWDRLKESARSDESYDTDRHQSPKISDRALQSLIKMNTIELRSRLTRVVAAVRELQEQSHPDSVATLVHGSIPFLVVIPKL